MGLSTAGLSVGKAGRLGAFEGLSDEGQHRNLVDVLVAVFHVERVVERKLMLFDVLCQVHLQPKQRVKVVVRKLINQKKIARAERKSICNRAQKKEVFILTSCRIVDFLRL